jgi:hypothetical protein
VEGLTLCEVAGEVVPDFRAALLRIKAAGRPLELVFKSPDQVLC